MITNFKIFENIDSEIVWGMFQNNPEQVMYGIANGGDVDVQDGNGETSLMFMAKRLRYETTWLKSKYYTNILTLINKGANWNLVDENGKDFLDYVEEEVKDELSYEFKEKYKEYLINKDLDKFNI